VWEETLEKVFRTKQPTLHAISALFPLSHVVLKVVAFLGVRHFDWGHLHVNAPSDPDGHSGIGGVFWMPMDDVLFLPCARHKCPEATGSIDRLFAGTVATKVGGSPHKQSSSAKLHPQAHVCQRSHGSCHHASPVLDCMDAESIKFC
jgi:hypothetical protein